MTFRSFILLSVGLLFMAYAFSQENTDSDAGFEIICQIYTEALNSNMTKEQRSNYIFNNIESRVRSKDALEAHDVVFQVDPADRYIIFKQSAKIVLKRDWHCKAVEALMR